MDISIAAGELTVPAHKDYLQEANSTLYLSAASLQLNISSPLREYSEFAVCLSPQSYGDEALPISRLLEWRQYFADIGVERSAG